MTGRGKPCPVPAHCAGTVDGVTSRTARETTPPQCAGTVDGVTSRTARETTPPLRGTPPKRGIYGGGFRKPTSRKPASL
jgi:hypothetical protein